ncbi:hypothetical protein GmHk_02G004650 [Glycine max]|nr:hypothetical protein GmHk_02G004650 [Glycine max]
MGPILLKPQIPLVGGIIGGVGVIGFLCPLWMSGCPDCYHWATRMPWSCACYWSRCDHQAILWNGSTDLPHFFLHGSRRTRVADSTNQGPTGGVDHRKKPEVGPSAARVSTKESCVDPSRNDLDTGDLDKCRLYIEQNPPRLIALERDYEGSTTVHNIPLLHDQVKVGIEEVKDADAPVPVPTSEGVVGPTKPADRPDHEVDDPLYLMALTIP